MVGPERDLQSQKEEIRLRSDILEVIGQYVQLKKAGKNWKGLCPFHSDRNPSFQVNPGLQIYKCFSCGEGGDVFAFIQKKENLDFLEAMEFLARRAGIAFERKAQSPERRNEREEMFALNALAAHYFQEKLAHSPDARAYLARRGVLKETQDRFQIGVAPDNWEGLTFYLEQRGADLALAARIGLVRAREGDRGGYYDVFRNRILFPIQDLTGRIIGFGGRALGTDPAKYINSEQSPLFDKSRTLYGLPFARKHLSSEKPPVFVEGYLDVVTTHQAGFHQCVATLGTAMTEGHARILSRYSPRVILCYDGDDAGIKATLRAAAVWETIGVDGAEVRIARLPEGDDPDSLLLRGETAAFQAALDNAVPRIDFQIERVLSRHDIRTEQGKGEALDEILPLLATLPSQVARDRYVQRIAYLHPLHERVNISQAIAQILADVELHARHLRAGRRDSGRSDTQTEAAVGASRDWPYTQSLVSAERRRSEGPRGSTLLTEPGSSSLAPPALTGVEKAERQLLRALFCAEWRAYILSRVPPDLLATPQGRRLFTRIARTPAGEDGSVDPLPLLRAAEAEETASVDSGDGEGPRPLEQPAQKMSGFLQEVLEDSAFLASNEVLDEAAVNDCIGRLRRHREDREIRELSDRMQHPEQLSPDELRACVEAYQRKVRARRGQPEAAPELRP